jgi:hypothetical protein
VAASGNPFVLDWRRLSRWCLLGTVVMVLWLLYPVARCSFASFRDTPLADVPESGGPASADKDRVEEGQGFFSTWMSNTKRCYAATPLLGQEDWKSYLLLSLAGATVATGIIARVANRRHGI